MSAPFFPRVEPVRFEGPESTSELAFRYYEPDRVVLGRRMEDQLRFAVCYWHSFCWPGSDVFGAGTFDQLNPGSLAAEENNTGTTHEKPSPVMPNPTIA